MRRRCGIRERKASSSDTSNGEHCREELEDRAVRS